MSHKMTRKEQLIAQLAKDDKFKDMFKLMASLANDQGLGNLSLADSYSEDSEEVSDDDNLDEDVSDDNEPPELCTDCKCGKKVVNSKTGTKTINKCQNTITNQTESILEKIKQKINPIVFEDFYDSEDNDEASDFEEQSEATNGLKADELTEEEKRKKRNEKKRLQKKKKRDKRKAEKESKPEPNGANKSEVNTNTNKTNNNKNNNNKNNNKKQIQNEINIKTESNTNTKTKHKTENKNETKTAAKHQKENQYSDKTDTKPKSKDMDNKSGPKSETASNGRNSRESQSAKSSPKSDRESDNIQSDVEEEELSLSSAYVAQIAQRKNKPMIIPTNYQKSAQNQTQNEAQDLADDSVAAKPKFFTENITNNSEFVIKNSTNSSLNNNNYNQNNNKSVLSNNSKEVDDFPKYKQYFFEKSKPAKAVAPPLTKEEKTLNVEKSVEMAILANHRAENNLFPEAIELFSQAIGFNPKDYRFYVNRSYCYDSIQDFRNALKDAEIAIKLKSDWPKCHYRKGKALAGLKNYAEAEIALKKVLTLESDCVEAIQDLKQVRYNAIIDTGYDVSTAELYSSNYDSIKEALSALSLRQEKQKTFNTAVNKSPNTIKNGNNWWNSAPNAKNGLEKSGRTGQMWDDDDIYISDDEYNSIREPTFEETSPTNPFGWKALWVGNVSLNAKLDTVTNMFRKFGSLNYCNIFKGNNGGNFILVHYDNADAPTLAMSKYQGKVIPGVSIADTPLTIRFRPNKDQKKPNYDQRLESDECYYWRTTGCARGDNCLYKHIQANKGVDKQAWMCNPLRKNPFQKPK